MEKCHLPLGRGPLGGAPPGPPEPGAPDGAPSLPAGALPQNVCEQVYPQSGYEASVQNLKNVSLTRDNVFGDDGGAHQLGTATGNVSSGYAVSLAVPIDTRTTPSGGGMGGGPGR